jgi:hypothetical protein
MIKELLQHAKCVDDKKASKTPHNDGIEIIPFGYFSKNAKNARGKRWTWEKAQLKNANRKIRYNKNYEE